jgi:hypothetical protein
MSTLTEFRRCLLGFEMVEYGGIKAPPLASLRMSVKDSGSYTPTLQKSAPSFAWNKNRAQFNQWAASKKHNGYRSTDES